MRECLKCGGSLYRDADTYCDHDFGDPPEPQVVAFDGDPIPWTDYIPQDPEAPHLGKPERLWHAAGVVCDEMLHVKHPTRDGAIAEWQERYRWGRFVDALFRTMTTWAVDGEAARANDDRIDGLEFKVPLAPTGTPSHGEPVRTRVGVEGWKRQLTSEARGAPPAWLPEVGERVCYQHEHVRLGKAALYRWDAGEGYSVWVHCDNGVTSLHRLSDLVPEPTA